MKQRIFLTLCFMLLLFCKQALATHIVGGEFGLEHRSGYTYRITLNVYFDDVNGNPGAIDPEARIRIFDKQTNTSKIDEISLPLRSNTFVNYTDIACTVGELRTRKLVYWLDVVLAPNVFNNPMGYYMVWERCCRNRIINNIVNPQSAGQTFYMEFPPVVQGNTPFVNSSPVLFPPLSDYACANELFYYDFSGTDVDGDSLVYDMVTPINGFSTADPFNAAPTPRPGPYPEIVWQPGYSRSNQIQGSPPISIDPQTGRLTVKPASKGLFVFGVRAQEFRKGVKIGEVRRDFQLLVKDCPRNDSPKVLARAAGQTGFYKSGDVIRIRPTDARCLNVVFTDPDPNSRITLYARPVNFSDSNYTFSGTTTGVINTATSGDSLKATLCFNECFDTEGKVYKLNLIVKDNGCSLPRQDTLQVSFIIDPIPNEPPSVNLSKPDRVFTVMEGDLIDFNVLGFDPDNDEVTISATGKNFDINSVPIQFQSRSGIGQVSSPFSWLIDCNALGITSYLIEFTATSNFCGEPITRTELIEVRTDYPNRVPVLTTNKETLFFEVDLNEPFEALFNGTDLDLHKLSMAATGQGFSLASLGMTFTSTGGNGTAEGKFNWVANCDAFRQGVVRVDFVLKEDACAPSPDQILTMEFKVRVPDFKTFTPPNIFTPNGDGLNDFFEIPGLPADVCTSTFQHIRIYNRWGKEVFASNDNTFRWDGKNVNDGVYFYVIDFGSDKYKGSVTLVR
ncbi:gliding motility-associated C-terminal domain-containing protein [Pontibacter sp. JH31]|uniref:Gliding motility-associated C-terminal domain-containing protein n=1 Tax=Pontibacter aquaedesilientis TaxID=2766980 RepID=A0ABR7XC95_9BACT|nr:gliding motility-associated C-terminal domain-containing protein [Pontibacter aquaedesilientis]MBD1395928.1 gliding motility-associated C-terminal domain-containing protein [Pontibacter aquaedesilientis]